MGKLDLEVVTATRLATSTKIAVTYILATAMFVVGTFAAAVFTTFSPTLSQDTTATPQASIPAVIAAPGIELTSRALTVNGVARTYLEVRIPASE